MGRRCVESYFSWAVNVPNVLVKHESMLICRLRLYVEGLADVKQSATMDQ